MRSRRNSIPESVRAEKSASIWGALRGLESFKNAAVIAFFAGFGSEVQTLPMIEGSLALGKRVLLPKVISNADMIFFEIDSIMKLEPGTMGIPEPIGSAEVFAGTPDMVLLPGLAFGRSGERLGYGRGYYDRYLQNLPNKVTKVALCYSEQLLDRVPMGDGDIAADYIITENESIAAAKDTARVSGRS